MLLQKVWYYIDVVKRATRKQINLKGKLNMFRIIRKSELEEMVNNLQDEKKVNDLQADMLKIIQRTELEKMVNNLQVEKEKNIKIKEETKTKCTPIPFNNYKYIKQAIRQDDLKHIIVETGEKNIYIPAESKFIVTKNFLVNATDVFGYLYYDSMRTIDLSKFDFSEITTMKHWFAHSYNLETVIFPAQMNMPKLNSLEAAFFSCESLKEVDLSWIVTDSIVDFTNTFLYCDNLVKVTLPTITIKGLLYDMTKN